MGERTGIEWADGTVNFWWGCTRVSAGCDHCYAATWANFTRGLKYEAGVPRQKIKGIRAIVRKLKRRAEKECRRMRVFPSMMDFCDAEVPTAWRDEAWGIIDDTRGHLDWLLLTKRPNLLPRMLPAGWGDGWPHVWLGTSVEDERAKWRLDKLAQVKAVVRFASMEPLIGPVDLAPWLRALDRQGSVFRDDPLAASLMQSAMDDGLGDARRLLDWVIVGGESGPGARPCDVAWIRSIMDHCAESGVACFVKQIGARPFDSKGGETAETAPRWKGDPKGGDWDEWPEPLRHRAFPS